MNLSLEERETVISFDEANPTAIIYTFNKRWIKHLEEKLGLEPRYKSAEGAREYFIPKARIPLPRAPRKMSAEQKKKAGERLKESRQNRVKSQKPT